MQKSRIGMQYHPQSTLYLLARQLVAAAAAVRRETIFMVTKNFGSPKKT